jgi:drug/metabolite transporter (DMT)-like permease
LKDLEINKGNLSAIFVAILWGLSFVAASVALQTLSPILLATLRFILASIIFLPIIYRSFQTGKIPDRKDLMEMFWIGFLSISIYFILQYTGVQYAGPGISAILVVGFIPILTGIISNLILKESFDLKRISGIVLGFIGVAIITIPNIVVESFNLRFLLGVSALLGNAVIFSLYSTLSRKLLKKYDDPALITAYVTVFGTLALLPISFSSDWSLIWVLSDWQWLSVFFLSIVCSGLAYFLWNYSLSKIDSVQAAVWLYLEPVAAFIGVYILFGSVPSFSTLFGGLLVLVGAMFTTMEY